MDQTYPEKKPIKRSEYIIVLSRDHHAGLLFCWKIKEGLKRGIDPQRIIPYIKYFWEEHLKDHFREEETLLFDKLDNELVARARQDHQLLTEFIKRITGGEIKGFKDYFSFTELLTDHIRFEERILFPFIEQQLPKTVLVNIAANLATSHSSAFNDTYADEFWVRTL